MKWKHKYNIMYTSTPHNSLSNFQCLLSEPQTNNGNVLNSEAAQLYNHNRLHYDQIVLKCIQATKPQGTPNGQRSRSYDYTDNVQCTLYNDTVHYIMTIYIV